MLLRNSPTSQRVMDENCSRMTIQRNEGGTKFAKSDSSIEHLIRIKSKIIYNNVHLFPPYLRKCRVKMRI